MPRRLLLLLFLWVLPCHSQPKRIVSTAPSITETLFALGLGDSVVGVTNYCTYPEAAKRKTRIGTFLNPDVEAITALNPDLVVVEKLPNHLPQQLDKLNIPWIEVEHDTVEDVFNSDISIARAAGALQSGQKLNEKLKQTLDFVHAKTARCKRVSAMFVIGHSPGTLQGLIVAGAHTYYTELLEITGATNVFSDTRVLYPQVSLEEVLRRNPDVIIGMVGPEPGKGQAMRSLWTRERNLRAVQTGKIFAVSSDVFVVPGPRVIEAARDLARLFHPEAAW